ncbi:DotI/IcmL family type IV secretion protein [Tatlockia sp. PL877]|uniref:DotI/IcmL family type IV secretion protein n=1 Tax=Legionella sp. W10-070 TaxID=1117709 RepID=UPI0013EF6DD4|nr:DotI/IcmL family type IV secretion protein [Legionella sp. W10-070]MDI9819543.1 DotI/IcmL family type IV secretion protein [Legionella sp. PL877]
MISTLLALSTAATATQDETQLAVWANEAIVATYSFNYKNFLPRQKEIAKYFTAGGWSAYSTALNASKLPQVVKENSYYVSAVATLPPEIKTIDASQWQATMPLLVVYKNPQYQQKQDLLVTIRFIQAPAGQGVRGLAIASLQAKVSQPPCRCQPENDTTTTKDDKLQSGNATQ